MVGDLFNIKVIFLLLSLLDVMSSLINFVINVQRLNIFGLTNSQSQQLELVDQIKNKNPYYTRLTGRLP